MSPSRLSPRGGSPRGGGISTPMKDSGLRRHSSHSINEGERRVLRSSAAGTGLPKREFELGWRGAARAKRFLSPSGPNTPL